jgi:hypothetical protein
MLNKDSGSEQNQVQIVLLQNEHVLTVGMNESLNNINARTSIVWFKCEHTNYEWTECWIYNQER